MKKTGIKKRTLWAFLLMLMLSGCVKNEFKIEFKFPKEYLGNYIVTYYARDSRGGMWIEQTASFTEGSAFVDGITRLPTIVIVSDASSNTNSLAFYVERGDKILISGQGKDMASWSVKGNKISERWSEWRNAAKAGVKDQKEVNKNIADFVKNNPSDKLSALIMLTEWDRREDADGFLKLWNSIDKKARSTELLEMAGVPDLLGLEFTTEADGSLARTKDPKLKKAVFRSRDNGVDTLIFNKVKASILYFYTDNNNSRKEAADSLKSLSKEYSDSLKRIITDVSVDTDSMTWISAIRNDSLKGAVRAWQPKGIAEEEMLRLGVIRVPWIIVKDKDGKETYSGDDLKEAVSAFRKEMDKKEPAAKNKPKAPENNKPKKVLTKPGGGKPVTNAPKNSNK